MDWILSIFSSFFSSKIKSYKEKTEKLRGMLDELEKGTVPMIKVETVEELLLRAKDYLQKFKGQRLYSLNGSLLPVIERLVTEIDSIHKLWWFRLLKGFKFQI